MYILNEKDYIRSVLASKKKPEDLSIGYLIVLTAKYYYINNENIEKKQLVEIVTNKISDMMIYGYQEYKWIRKIEKVCDIFYDNEKDKKSKKKEEINEKDKQLRELKYVPIYQEEIDLINSLPNDRQKKFMFTLYAVARYMDSDGWINKKDLRGLSEIFKLANITLTSDKKNELLHELYKNGYIYFSKQIDDLNIRVNLAESDNVVYKIKEFSNLGNQYIGNFKKGYRQCANPSCGKRVKMTAPNRIYCSKCAEEIDREKAKDRMKKLRNHKMFEADSMKNA